jgi:hypothetical protein
VLTELHVIGDYRLSSQTGKFNFDNIELIGVPSAFDYLNISSNAVDDSNAKRKTLSKYRKSVELHVDLRLCRAGEIHTDKNLCFVCTNKTVSLKENDLKCQDCPEFAQCYNGNEIKVQEGHWRAKKDNIKIFDCPNVELC